MSDDITLRPMRADDIAAADSVFRRAFGTWFGLADPMQFRGDAGLFGSRLWSYPEGGTVALRDGEMVGLSFASRWGSIAVIGPIAVLPELWRHGLARTLVAAALDTASRWQTPLAGLFTFPQSALHLRLYQSFDFWPRHLTPIMGKPVMADAHSAETIALSSARERDALAEECRALAATLHPGLDLAREIAVVLERGLGDVLALVEGSRVAGFAICHNGAGSDAGSTAALVKFAMARRGPGADERLSRILAGCESFAASRGATRLVASAATARIGAYRLLCAAGFRTDVPFVSMHRPYGPAYDGPEDWVLDDWR
ncbi:MAG TPA: GNAT family N-acetyltransferase [Stellaceae bacterium]|nr:GNAT family N-acetyltransferase [Stellaceae bacterium]